MDCNKIGHIQDWKRIEVLLQKIEFAVHDIKDAINERKYYEGEETTIKLIYTAQELHKQMGIMPMRVDTPRTLEEATPDEVKKIKQLNNDLATATQEIIEFKSTVKEALQTIESNDTEYRGCETHMACLVGENDFAYRGTESFIHYDIVFPIEGTEPLNPEETWDNRLHEFQACELFCSLFNNSSPSLWLDDILRIDTIILDTTLKFRRFIKTKTKN